MLKIDTKKENITNNVLVSGNVNDTYKLSDKERLKVRKREAIEELKTYSYKTPPRDIEHQLKIIFEGYDTKPGHWLYVAQTWNPRAINRVIAYILKVYERRQVNIFNPPAYFTDLIKRRKKRRASK